MKANKEKFSFRRLEKVNWTSSKMICLRLYDIATVGT